MLDVRKKAGPKNSDALAPFSWIHQESQKECFKGEGGGGCYTLAVVCLQYNEHAVKNTLGGNTHAGLYCKNEQAVFCLCMFCQWEHGEQ